MVAIVHKMILAIPILNLDDTYAACTQLKRSVMMIKFERFSGLSHICICLFSFKNFIWMLSMYTSLNSNSNHIHVVT